jgi:hypothetical protein
MIDIIDGNPVILDKPIEVDFEPVTVLESLPTIPIYDDYTNYLTPKESKYVRLTSDGITVDAGKYLCSFHQGDRTHKEVAEIIKSILNDEKYRE